MKNFARVFIFVCTILLISCKAYSQDTVPYVISGEFVMNEDSEDYSICGVDFYLLNKSEKEIKTINIIFFLFDQDGEPASECRNKISVEVEKCLIGGESCSFCLSLDSFMNTVPASPLLIDYLYLGKIEYLDGSLWEDPFGLVAFK